jgi:serine/threonine protein kinase
MAETRTPHFSLDPMQVIFRIPKEPAPTLKDPNRWSAEFRDFLSLCLQKKPETRATAKQLLFHPFVLKGSSTELLGPLVKYCIPIIEQKRTIDLLQKVWFYIPLANTCRLIQIKCCHQELSWLSIRPSIKPI